MMIYREPFTSAADYERFMCMEPSEPCPIVFQPLSLEKSIALKKLMETLEIKVKDILRGECP